MRSGGKTVAVCMTDADYVGHNHEERHRFWKASLRQAPLTNEILGSRYTVGSLRTVSANTARLRAVCGSGWLAVGDAAVSYDPLSGSGLEKALESAHRAAQSAADWLDGQPDSLSSYAAWAEQDFTAYLRQYRHYYGQVNRWPDSSFWARRKEAFALI